MTDEFNCYQCRWRGTIPGDRHSRCLHPAIGLSSHDLIENHIAFFAGETAEAADKLGITGNPHGIAQGWFMWPINFDPVWLKSCNGFEAKEKKTTSV